jgi:D-beta-D-heptose 7-phosphate kinase/D-beta-D-heptose 1-phosphate adenosyltransferase
MISSTLLNKFLTLSVNSRPKINVIGDMLIDEYYDVKCKVNPESCIPAFNIRDFVPRQKMPGGAGNINYILKNFDIDVSLIGALDGYGRETYRSYGFDVNLCIDRRQTPRKLRFYDGGQYVFRLDIEDIEPSYLDCGLSDSDCNIFADYNKGVFHGSRFDMYKAVVDPKTADLSKWLGCDTIKLNASEARRFSGEVGESAQLEFIKTRTKAENVIITRSERGITGLLGNIFMELNQPLVNALNVVGAGDCFNAVYSYALALGLEPLECCELALFACVSYVQCAVSKSFYHYDFLADKVVLDERFLAKRDFKMVFTNGCFDIIHAGHIDYLRFAKSKGDKLVVGVNTDESVKRLKGDGRPVNCLEQRLEVLRSLDLVDFVVPFADDTPLELIIALRPEVLVKGKPYTGFGDVVGSDIAGEVFIAPTIYDASSSALVEYI